MIRNKKDECRLINILHLFNLILRNVLFNLIFYINFVPIQLVITEGHFLVQ